jgi:hypothetical protein
MPADYRAVAHEAIEGTEAQRLATGLTPWVMICTSPRETIRAIVDTDPRRRFVMLALLAGLAGAVFQPGSAVWYVAVVAPLASLVGLWVSGWLVSWTGGLLGGVASPVEVRAALAWAEVPNILAAVIAGPTLVFLGAGEETFAPVARAVFGILVGIWVSILNLVCVSEVHRFSLWRALGATLLAGLVVGVPVVLGVLIAVLLGAR